MDHLTISLFGPFQISVNQQELLGMNTVRGSLLLAYLTLEDGKPHLRKNLSRLFWPRSSTRAAQNSLRQTLYRIKSTVQKKGNFDQFFKTTRHMVQFEKASSHWIDVKAFQQLLSQSKQGNYEQDEKLKLAKQMAQLYRGEFLSGMGVDDAADLDHWLQSRRAWFHHQAVENLQKLSAAYVQRGQLELAQIYVDRLLSIDPINERGFEKKVEILLEKGQTAEAKAQFEQFKQTLMHHIGIEPSLAIGARLKHIPQVKTNLGPHTEQQLVKTNRFMQPSPTKVYTLPSPPSSYFPYMAAGSAEAKTLKDFLPHSASKTLLIQGVPGSGKSALMAELGRHLAVAKTVFYVDFKVHAPADIEELTLNISQPTQKAPPLFLLDHLDRVPEISKLVDQIHRAAPQATIIGASRLPVGINGPNLTKIYHTGLDQISAIQMLQSSAAVLPHNHPTDSQILHQIANLVGSHPGSIQELLRWNQIFSWSLILQKIKLNEFLWDETPLSDWFDMIWQSLSEPELAFMSRFGRLNDRVSPEDLANAPLGVAKGALVGVERGLFQKSADGALKCHPLFRCWIRAKTRLLEPEVSQPSLWRSWPSHNGQIEPGNAHGLEPFTAEHTQPALSLKTGDSEV